MAKKFTKSDNSEITVNACRECPSLKAKKTPSGTRRYCAELNDVVDKKINQIDTNCPLPEAS
jgi:hypothetical protein